MVVLFLIRCIDAAILGDESLFVTETKKSRLGESGLQFVSMHQMNIFFCFLKLEKEVEKMGISYIIETPKPYGML